MIRNKKNNKSYPTIYFFIGLEGLSMGRLISEQVPVLSMGEKTVNVTLKNPFAGLFGSEKTHSIINVDKNNYYDLPIVVNGERQEMNAKVFLHDYLGNPLSGVIPLRIQVMLEQLEAQMKVKNAMIATSNKDMKDMVSMYEKRIDRLLILVKKMRETFYSGDKE